MKSILVFPCGSEIGLEIHRSLQFNTHFKLLGASSTNDHGRFVFENYIGGIPYHDHPDFIDAIRELVSLHKIDAIYPAMDAVAATLKKNEAQIGCIVIGSGVEATTLCASKSLTYERLHDLVPIPALYPSVASIPNYPVFIKPDVGYGARHVHLAHDAPSASQFLAARKSSGKQLICDYLPGREFTIDCFSDRHGVLRFAGARGRDRISNGISVNTSASGAHAALFEHYARTIQQRMHLRGAWFFQMREDADGQPKLLEVAARLGGSSSLFRSKGVNFAALSAYDAFGIDVEILINDYAVELDRGLSSRYKIQHGFDTVYVDYDDCLIIHGQVNSSLVAFLFQSINAGKRVILITRHAGDLTASIDKMRLPRLFDQIIHLRNGEKKSLHIQTKNAIFIDDSFAERKDVASVHGVPVFSPDMVEALV